MTTMMMTVAPGTLRQPETVAATMPRQLVLLENSERRISRSALRRRLSHWKEETRGNLVRNLTEKPEGGGGRGKKPEVTVNGIPTRMK